MSLPITLRAEILKTKRSASFYLTLFAAAFGPLMSLLDLLLEGVEIDNKKDILNDMLTNKFQIVGGMLTPFFIMLVCTLLPQIEYKNNGWKQVLSSPQSKLDIFLAKFLNIQWLIFLFLILNFAFMLIVAVVLHFKQPELNVFSQSVDVREVVAARLNTYTALLAMCAVQFWLGLHFKNFIIPLAIGIALWFVGTILVLQIKAPGAVYFPYSYHIYPNFKVANASLNRVLWLSGAYTILFLALGYWDFTRHEKRKP